MARLATIAFLALALLVAGCPGELQNPERFTGGACDAEALIAASCAISMCHDGTTAAVGLDLSGPDAAARLVGTPPATAADHMAAACEGEGPLIDPARPADSLLLDKVTSSPSCGRPMPYGSRGMSAADRACLRTWVEAAVSTGGDAGVGDGGGADASALDGGEDGGL